MSNPLFTPRKQSTPATDIFTNTPSTISQFHRRYNDFPPVAKTLTPIKNISIQYEHPDIKKIEKRVVNKELETRKIIMNVFVFLVSNLAYKFLSLLFSQLEISHTLKSHVDITYWAENLLFLLKILVIYNIGTGVYQLFKKSDEFKDINLTPQQRQLLGLPAATSSNSVIPDQGISPVNSIDAVKKTEPHTGPAPQSNSWSIFNKDPISKTDPSKIANIGSTSGLFNKPNSLLASPMSSPHIKRFTTTEQSGPNLTNRTSMSKPSETEQSFISKMNSSSLLSKQTLNAGLNTTPSYIPSPKYYYRMDSPSRPRRRV
ncbi:hypothetical protein WICPIJ_002357 [Wickerhamomyces pijperi]|uniref:Nucleoporin POM34 n=1 Tax=Wickerhamomyces pijperi TaxID=599730 RepID=A0A9P8TPR4_WICPI|nr:hypothetical protein WICPIJ_002357 [Wickerhamomyces pijperi]